MFPKRMTALAALFALLLGAVLVQLVRLQLVQGTVYAELARKGRVWDELVPAPRGRILDRNGALLACDRAEYGLAVVASRFPLERVGLDDVAGIRQVDAPAERARLRGLIANRMATTESSIATLASLSGIDAQALSTGLLLALESAVRYGGERIAEPFVFGLDRDRWIRMDVVLNPPSATVDRRRARADVPIPGIRCVSRAARAYPAGTAVGHLVGHIGEYDADEVETLRTWGRLASGGASALELFTSACAGPRVASAVGVLIGRSPETVATGEELAELLGGLDETALNTLDVLLGPAAGELRFWLARRQIVTLAEGELVWMRSRGHLSDRRIGRIGVEHAFNDLLRGRHGYRVVIRNLALNEGEPVPELDYLHAERPRPGADVSLEIDLELQLAACAALEATGLPGAAVLVEPATGAILAAASVPSFDPNTFVARNSRDVAALLADPGKPMIARALAGVYPPGSVFKVVVALAGLEEGVLTPTTTFDCRHSYAVGASTLRCLADPGHGKIDLSDALTMSCNIFFYQTAEHLGAERLLKWARALGFASRTGLDVGGEAPGFLPRARPGGEMLRRTLVQLGIGQGPITATPLQVAQLFSAVANDGPIYRPRLVRGDPRASSATHLSPATRAALMKGLIGTVHAVRGTAHTAFSVPLSPGGGSFVERFPGVTVAAKTGTAERGTGTAHSWFAGFAPADEPCVAFAFIVEGAGHGGDVAAPVAARVLASFFASREGAGGGGARGAR
jgi:cell division protein FtsI/penicillin-binding protein 2